MVDRVAIGLSNRDCSHYVAFDGGAVKLILAEKLSPFHTKGDNMKKLTTALAIAWMLVIGVISVDASCIEVPVEVATSVHIDPNGGHPIWKPPDRIGAGIPGRPIWSSTPEVVLHTPAEWDGQTISLNLVAEFYHVADDDPLPGDQYLITLEMRDPIDGTLIESLGVHVTVPDPWDSAFKVNVTWDEFLGLISGETYLISPAGVEDPPINRFLTARVGGIRLCFSTGAK